MKILKTCNPPKAPPGPPQNASIREEYKYDPVPRATRPAHSLIIINSTAGFVLHIMYITAAVASISSNRSSLGKEAPLLVHSTQLLIILMIKCSNSCSKSLLSHRWSLRQVTQLTQCQWQQFPMTMCQCCNALRAKTQQTNKQFSAYPHT